MTYISQKSKALFNFFWREELARSKAPCILQWHEANWLPWMQHHRTVEISRLPFISAKAPYRYKNNISHALPNTKIRRIPLVQNASREGIGRLSRDPIVGTKNYLAASPVAQDGGEQNDSPASVPTETLLTILSNMSSVSMKLYTNCFPKQALNLNRHRYSSQFYPSLCGYRSLSFEDPSTTPCISIARDH